MIATHWYPSERRRQFERPLLDHYHRALLSPTACRITTAAALAEDYRRSVLMQPLLPPLRWSAGILPWVWWNHLEAHHGGSRRSRLPPTARLIRLTP